MRANNSRPALEAIARLRRDGARVHCITNTVAQTFTANVLLACGASPSMTVAPAEAAAFTRASDALLVNLGTLDDGRREAIMQSLTEASAARKPILLDPVKCDLSPLRLEFAQAILPQAGFLKANAAEALALGDSRAPCTIMTGPMDRIVEGSLSTEVANGNVLMDRVVAMGCALGALIAALAVHSETSHDAALAGLVWFGVAGEKASGKASGPGTFQPHFLDALASLDLQTLETQARIK